MRKMVDSKPLLMHWKLTSGIQVKGDFIDLSTSLNGSTIWALVLVDIFDSFDETIEFQIDMTIKLDHEFSWMRNYMSIVKSILALLDSPSILRESIVRISILFDHGLIGKGFGKALFANIVLKTSLRRARTIIEHDVSGDSEVELRMNVGIRKLC